GEAADCIFDARQTDDARAVGEGERHLVVAVAADAQPETPHECGGLAQEFAALAGARANYDDQAAWPGIGVVDGLGRGDGGLSPLPRTVQQAAADGIAEYELLVRVGMETEPVPGELHAVQFEN